MRCCSFKLLLSKPNLDIVYFPLRIPLIAKGISSLNEMNSSGLSSTGSTSTAALPKRHLNVIMLFWILEKREKSFYFSDYKFGKRVKDCSIRKRANNNRVCLSFHYPESIQLSA